MKPTYEHYHQQRESAFGSDHFWLLPHKNIPFSVTSYNHYLADKYLPHQCIHLTLSSRSKWDFRDLFPPFSLGLIHYTDDFLSIVFFIIHEV